MTLIQKFNPINKEEEKKKFFFDSNYNPQFRYEDKISTKDLEQYGDVSDEYFAKAKKILDSVINKWGKESLFLEEVEGRILSRDEVTETIRNYLRTNDLENKVSIRFSTDFLARTAVIGYTLNVRLPVEYREHSLIGVLDHEIGTHMYRRLNEERQPWNKKRNEYGLGPFTETEEGLASLHSYLSASKPYLWIGALRYYVCVQATKMSFVELYEDLKKYVDDRERRWKIVLRAKRGISDTSVPGAIAKDQVYFSGVISILRWLRKNNFDPRQLYVGKISEADLSKAWHISPQYEPLLPTFLLEKNLKEYVSGVKNIEKQNMLEKI